MFRCSVCMFCKHKSRSLSHTTGNCGLRRGPGASLAGCLARYRAISCFGYGLLCPTSLCDADPYRPVFFVNRYTEIGDRYLLWTGCCLSRCLCLCAVSETRASGMLSASKLNCIRIYIYLVIHVPYSRTQVGYLQYSWRCPPHRCYAALLLQRISSARHYRFRAAQSPTALSETLRVPALLP